jgi:hypothetical protein
MMSTSRTAKATPAMDMTSRPFSASKFRRATGTTVFSIASGRSRRIGRIADSPAENYGVAVV